MNATAAHAWDSIRSSFWFVPGLMGLGAVVAAWAVPSLDEQLPADSLPWARTTVTAARATLTAIGGAMVAVSGTLFSITIVTLSLTSQQFGPRLLRSFMDDATTQITLGSFLSTSLYCLLVLRTVEDRAALSAPALSVTLALALTVFCMALLIYFIHHVATSIQAPSVVTAVARDLDASIERLFPASPSPEDAAGDREGQPARECDGAASSRAEGYVQSVDTPALLKWAAEEGLTVELLVRPGRFLRRGQVIAKAWSESAELDEAILSRLQSTIIVGARRTPRQDVECAVEELVEVAVRSLSPGINDPFTAINCIDRLGASLGRLAQRGATPAERFDEAGVLRLVVPTTTFPEVLDTAFHAIRQSASGVPSVLIRLLEALEGVHTCALRPVDHRAIERHADMIWRAARRSVEEEHDLSSIRERYGRIRPAAKTIE